MNTVPKIDTATARPANIDPAEWETRVDLAACYRLVDLYGMTDLHLNHISARVPGNEEHFLINPFGMMYEEITASSLIKVDLDGKIIANSNPDYGINLRGLRDPQRDPRRAPRRRLRAAHPHQCRHGGLGAQMRAAAADPDRDALGARSPTTTSRAWWSISTSASGSSTTSATAR